MPDDAARRRAAGELEAAVLAVLQAVRAPMSPAQVRERLGGDLAYTTVVTILSRLHGKGVLDRRKAGRAYVYAPVTDEPGLAARRMTRVLDSEPDREAVLARFVSSLSGTDEELLRRMLGEPRQAGRLPVHLAVYLPLVLPLLAAVAARPLAERLQPRAATWLLSVSALALAAASSAALGLLALSALIRIPLVDALSGMSRLAISRHDPASVPVAIAAGALLTAAAASAVRALKRRTAALVAAGREARDLPGTGQVVVTDDDAADAYTLPGLPCRIVITAGMMRALSDTERQVLLAHERAHAAGFHYLFTTAARLAAAANPLLRPLATATGYAVERWADERAAATTGDRPTAARAIARAALAAAASPPRQHLPRRQGGDRDRQDRRRHQDRAVTVMAAVGSPAPARARLRRAGPVPRRVAALLRPAPQPRLLLLTAAVLLVAFAGASALEAATDLHGMLVFARAAAGHG